MTADDRIQAFFNDDTGATAMEYGLLIAFVAIAIIGAVTLFGNSLAGVFTNETLNSTLNVGG
ncbi:MAG: Flp family type IVb pilin [Alphaproteobacteria bacterium]|jgi:pilus assembly protein Flp/PilA|nr:Flp family type IVb pilin [Alphaproteobacteria bacterium]